MLSNLIMYDNDFENTWLEQEQRKGSLGLLQYKDAVLTM